MNDKVYEKRREEELNELLNSEQEIKNSLTNNNSVENKYKNYGLLDKNWLDNYKNDLYNILYNKTRNELNFNINFICPKKKTETYRHYKNQKNNKKAFNLIKYTFPTNFILVSEKFINLLSMNLNQEIEKTELKKCIYPLIISGYCIIIQDPNNGADNYITIYDENKGNSIDYALRIYNKEEMKNNIDLILKHGLRYYFNHMGLSFRLEYQKIQIDEKIIGSCFRNCDIERIKLIFKINNFNILDEQKNMKSKINSFLFCLYLIRELKNELNNTYLINEKNKGINFLFDYFQNIENELSLNNIIQQFPWQINNEKFSYIISLIFEGLDSELSQTIENNNYDQVDQYDEQKSKQKFLQQSQNGSIFQKIFFIPQETKIFCTKCKVPSYKYEFIKFLLIKLEQEKGNISLNEKIFSMYSEKYKKEKCVFCGGTETICNIDKFFIGFPEILVVIIEGDNQFNKFDMKNNLCLFDKSKSNISYSLVHFIEHNTNIVYFNENEKWNKYINNSSSEKVEFIEKITPKILFYKKNNNKNCKTEIINNIQLGNNISNILNNFPNNSFIGNNIYNNIFVNNINNISNMNNKTNINNNIENENYMNNKMNIIINNSFMKLYE